MPDYRDAPVGDTVAIPVRLGMAPVGSDGVPVGPPDALVRPIDGAAVLTGGSTGSERHEGAGSDVGIAVAIDRVGNATFEGVAHGTVDPGEGATELAGHG